MKRIYGVLVFLLFSVVIFSCQQQSTIAPEQVAKQTDQYEIQYTDNYFVQYSDIKLSSAAEEFIASKGGKLDADISDIGFTVVKGLKREDAMKLTQWDDVISVTRDVRVRWIPKINAADVQKIDIRAGATAHSNPADAAFFDDFQWNMRQIDADDAWNAGLNAKGARVAILDTGINPDHIDMAGRVNIGLSRTFVTESDNPDDLTSFDDFNFHGTHVAGIVSTNGIGTAGVAPGATLIAVKVLDATGSGSFSDVIDGILYAAKIKVDVINMSLGATIPNTPEFKPLLDALSKAVSVAINRGVYVVAAAGNEARNLDVKDLVEVPAQSDRYVAAISATGPINQQDFDRLASYSNFGKRSISVAAPGGDFLGVVEDFILSPCSPSATALPFDCGTGSYLFVVGTSQAAPHVSGAGAMVRANQHIKGTRIFRRIEKTADDLGNPVAHGHGRLNVFNAVKFPGG